jgi:hypothetical protein
VVLVSCLIVLVVCVVVGSIFVRISHSPFFANSGEDSSRCNVEMYVVNEDIMTTDKQRIRLICRLSVCPND